MAVKLAFSEVPRDSGRTPDAHLEEINAVLFTIGDVKPIHSFFLSHRQDNAGDLAEVLHLKISAATPLPCWFDQEETEVTQKGFLFDRSLCLKLRSQHRCFLSAMAKGIAQSAVFMLILTKGVFERPWVLFECRTAKLLKKKIVTVAHFYSMNLLILFAFHLLLHTEGL